MSDDQIQIEMLIKMYSDWIQTQMIFVILTFCQIRIKINLWLKKKHLNFQTQGINWANNAVKVLKKKGKWMP